MGLRGAPRRDARGATRDEDEDDARVERVDGEVELASRRRTTTNDDQDEEDGESDDDVRQPLEHAEWRLVGTKSAPYLVPMENVLRRASGYFLAIKGGLKERNVAFVDVVAEVTKNRRDAV